MIPQSFIHDLLSRADIVDTIDRYVPLKRAGANFVACCPFHNEKTPSFTVSQSKQFYHCFGCGAHGNAIGFLIEFSGLSFIEAVHDLAAHLGVQVPEIDARHSSANDQAVVGVETGYCNGDEVAQKALVEVLHRSMQYYREQLKVSDKAITYLKERGVSGKIAARFAIGYAPADWQGLKEVFPDYSSERTRNLLTRAGLAIINDGGKQYDRFRDRIMFPILNQKGQIVGFGGRVLGKEEPKYLNSPETVLFEKGRELYNFFSARRAIRNSGYVIVVEGYMDVLALAQYGFDNAVATLGTATSSFHIQALFRQTDAIIFCFDGDNAGRKAAWRALENCLPLLTDDKSVSFLFLPENADPDSFVRDNGKEAFTYQIKHALPLSDFLFKELSLHKDLQTSEGRAKLVHTAKPLLQQVQAPALSLLLLNRLAEMSGMDRNELQAILPFKRPAASRQVTKQQRRLMTSHCRRLLRALLYNPGYITKLNRNLLVECGENSEEFSALKSLIEFLDRNPHLINNESSILNYWNEDHQKAFLQMIEGEVLEWNDSLAVETEFLDTLKKLQLLQDKKRMAELHSKSLSKLTEDEKRELQRLSMQ